MEPPPGYALVATNGANTCLRSHRRRHRSCSMDAGAPDDATAFYDQGKAYFEAGDYEKALAEFDKAIELKPDYAEAIVTAGALSTPRIPRQGFGGL